MSRGVEDTLPSAAPGMEALFGAVTNSSARQAGRGGDGPGLASRQPLPLLCEHDPGHPHSRMYLSL